MPCDSVAVVSSKLRVNPGIILESEQGHTAAKTLFAKAMNTTADRVYVQVSNYKPRTLTLSALGVYAYVRENGEIEISGRNRALNDKVLAILKLQLEQLAGVMVQLKVQAEIKRRFEVTETTRNPSGQIVMTFNL